jgi:hypothetical protein
MIPIKAIIRLSVICLSVICLLAVIRLSVKKKIGKILSCYVDLLNCSSSQIDGTGCTHRSKLGVGGGVRLGAHLTRGGGGH